MSEPQAQKAERARKRAELAEEEAVEKGKRARWIAAELTDMEMESDRLALKAMREAAKKDKMEK